MPLHADSTRTISHCNKAVATIETTEIDMCFFIILQALVAAAFATIHTCWGNKCNNAVNHGNNCVV